MTKLKNTIKRIQRKLFRALRSIRVIRNSSKKKRILLRIGLITIVILLPLVAIYTYKAMTARGAWSGAHREWAKRKNVTVTNNSTDSLAAGTTVAITVDTKSLYDSNDLQEDCDDLRVLYSTDGQAWTELDRYVSPTADNTCATSTATKVYFPLQLALASSTSSTSYYLYYSNSGASAPSGTIDAFDTSSANALLVCPFDGDTDCINSSGLEQPTTESGAIRYSSSKTALQFDGLDGDYVSVPALSDSDGTIEFWFYQSGDPTAGQGDVYFNKYSSIVGDGLYITLQPDHKFDILYNYSIIIGSTTDIQENQWNHLALTFGSTGMKLYINGVSAGSSSSTVGLDDRSQGTMTIGNLSTSENDSPRAKIDEFRISNVVRYTENFTPQTTPFVRDPYTKLLLHFDEGGDQPYASGCTAGEACDDSGNGNHGTITGAKYVTGLVGVDNGTSDAGYQSNQSYSSHEGIFIEEGTTNLIKNPSFDHSTFNTLWSDEEDDSTVFNLATASATFTPNMAKRNAPGPFTTAPIVQGDFNATGTPDSLTYSRGSQINGNFYENLDSNQGSIVFWITPEWDGDDGLEHYIFSGEVQSTEMNIRKDSSGYLIFANPGGHTAYVSADVSSWTAGTTYSVVARWDMNGNTLYGTNYASLSINGNHNFYDDDADGAFVPSGTNHVGSDKDSLKPANAIIEGLTVYRRPLYESTTPSGIDVGNGDEISQIYNGGSGQDPTLVTGSWDVVFALPTDQSTGTLGTTGQAWSHPHSSNLLSNGFFMDTPVFNDWELEGTPSATGSAATAQKIFAGGGYVTSDAADEGIYQDITVTAGDDWVIRALGHSDGTCDPKVILYDQTGTAEIGSLTGSTSSDRDTPDVYIFTGEAPTSSTTLRVKLVNTASSGTCYWHQVEVLDNLIDNPSMERVTGTPDPWVPDGWSNFTGNPMEEGDGIQLTSGVHSGSSAFRYDTWGGGSEGLLTNSGSVSVGTFYSFGCFLEQTATGANYRIGNHENENYQLISHDSPTARWFAEYNGDFPPSWELITDVLRGNDATSGEYALIQFDNDNSYQDADDFYLFANDSVTLTVTAADEDNSAEDWGLRVDGRDTLTQSITGLTTTAGTIRFRYTPRHDAADALDFLEDTNVYIGEWYGDSDDYIQLYWSAANTITLAYSMGGSTGSDVWDATGLISAGSTYETEIAYTGGGDMSYSTNGTNRITLSSIPSAFGTAPSTAHWGKRNSGSDDRQADAVYSDPSSNPGSGNITDTEETSAPYYKFGSKSAKLVAGANDYYTIRAMVSAGTTYTLSAYIYDGTSGNIGGTVDNTIAQLVFNGSNKSDTSYTDMGGGWWRLTYSASAIRDGVQHFGVYALNGKTIYVDGVQLEEKSESGTDGYSTSYTDGSLGTGYSWTSTANESTSAREGGVLLYPKTDNFNINAFTVSVWVQPSFNSNDYPDGTWTKVIWSVGDGTSNRFYIEWITQSGADIKKWMAKKVVSGSTIILKTAEQSFNAGDWQHLVYTYDNVNGTSLYLNGSLADSDPDTNVPTITSDVMGIGNYFNSGFKSNVSLSNFRIYDDSLSLTEVQDLYYSGLVAHSESIEVERHDDAKGQAPVGIWHFDEGYGTTAYDSSMYGNDLTIVDATASGDLDSSNSRAMHLEFDGTNSYLERLADTDFAFDDDSFSIAGWLRHPSSISSAQSLVTNYSSGSDYGGWKVYMDSSGHICFAIDDDATWTPDDVACSSGSYADSSWHSFQAVKSSTESLTLYLDGQEIASDATLTAQNSLTNNANLYVGVDSDGTSNHWQGFLDEIIIYPYARSADQAKTDATSGPHQTSAVFGLQEDNLMNGLVGYWKMDESSDGSGAVTRTDSSGNGNDLTDASPYAASGTGKFGNGTDFEADNSEYLSILDNATLSMGDEDFTLTAWVNLEDKSTDRYIINKAVGATQYDREYALRYSSSADRFSFSILNGVGDSSSTVSANNLGSPSTGTWYLIVAWHDADENKIGISVNAGNPDYTYNTIDSQDQHGNFVIGREDYAGMYYFDGKIDEVRVYKRVLSPDEIQSLYNWAPGPVGWWKMDEYSDGSSAVTRYDSSGNGNNLTDINTTPSSIGKYGNGAEFDYTIKESLSITDANQNGLSITGPITIEAWYSLDYSHTGTIIVSKQADDDRGYSLNYVDAGSGGTPNFRVSSDGSSFDGSISSTTSVTAGSGWKHIAGVYDGSYLYLYVDGVQANAPVPYSSGINDTAGSFRIGTGEHYEFPPDGRIDDVRVYNYARTPQQIVEDMNAGHPAPGSPVGSAIGHWSFDEGYGDTAYDSSSQGNNGNLGGSGQTCPGDANTSCPSWTNNGKFGKALDFDLAGTTDDWVSMGDPSSLELEMPFTLSAWVNLDQLPSTAGSGFAVLSKYLNSSTNNFVWQIDPNDVLYIWKHDGVSGEYITETNFDSSDVESWVHVVFTIDASGKANAYKNGVLVDSSTAGSTDMNTTTAAEFFVGARNSSPSSNFDGNIDEVSVYNSTLTADQVKLLYNQGKSAVFGATSTDSSENASYSASSEYCPPGNTDTCNPPVAEWKMDKGSGQYAYDTSENNNTGTLGTGSSVDSADPTWVPSSRDSSWALEFDGSESLIDAGNGSSINNLHYDAMTVEAWIRNDNWGEFGDGEAAFLINKNNTSGWRIIIRDIYGLEMYVNSGTDARSRSGNDEYTNDGLWHHLTFTYDNDGDRKIYMYIDGAEINSYEDQTAATGTAVDDSTGDLIIGNNATPIGTATLDGAIDEIRIYDYVRTPAQIAWDYNQGGPVGHWRMDECSGGYAYDSSGNGNTGTITIGGTGTQDDTGTCTSGDTGDAWYNGATGKFNSSLNFDGSDDYVNLDSVLSKIQNNATGTISFWYKRSGGNNDVIFSINDTDGNSTLQLENRDGTYFMIQMINGGLFDWSLNTSSNSISTTEFRHYVLVQDSTRPKFYVDGVENSLSFLNQDDLTGWLDDYSGFDNVRIGCINRSSLGNDAFMNGQIDDVRIYNYALTPLQIKTLYNNGAVRFGP